MSGTKKVKAVAAGFHNGVLYDEESDWFDVPEDMYSDWFHAEGEEPLPAQSLNYTPDLTVRPSSADTEMVAQMQILLNEVGKLKGELTDLRRKAPVPDPLEGLTPDKEALPGTTSADPNIPNPGGPLQQAPKATLKRDKPKK